MTLSTPVATSVRSCGALGPARAVADSSTSSSNCGTATSAPSPKGARILPDRPTTQPPDPQGLLSARYHFGSNAQPTRERHIILHAHNRDKNAHRSYRLDRIEEASVTSEPFVPRFAVELTLLVRPASRGSFAKCWTQSVRIDGRPTSIGLGRYPVVTLAMARERALENARGIVQGHDPRRRSNVSVPTFKNACETVIAIHSGNWNDGGRTEHQ